MPFVLKLQSAIEHQISSLGPPELVSIAAELLVAAILFLPVAGLIAFTGWWLKRGTRLRPQLQIHGAGDSTTLIAPKHGAQKKVA